MKLMVRADDLGYSKGVNYGIYESVKSGIIQNIGFMVNMPDSEHGYNLIKDFDVCLGQHTNLCVGRPLSDLDKIPSLIQKNGMFKTSKMYRSSESDFVNLDEAILEIEAQYEKFKYITGQEPHYFEAHAVQSENLLKAIEIVGTKHGLKVMGVSFDGTPVEVNGKKVYMWLDSMKANYDPMSSFVNMMENAHEDGYDLFICHPGFLDNYIMNTSSLTIPRTKEVKMLCSNELKECIRTNNVHLYTYDEL